MSMRRTPYPPEVRREVVALAAQGCSVAELCQRFGCSARTVANWLAAERSFVDRAELDRLRRENDRLRIEKDVLVKAANWFAARQSGSSHQS